MTESHIVAFPKIAALGTRYVENIFKEEVEITEKVDGSQFVFGWTTDGEFQCRSKGKEIHVGSQDKMFNLAVNYTSQLEPHPGFAFYSEYLQRPKHSTLSYARTPLNNLMLFGVSDFNRQYFCNWQDLSDWSERLSIAAIPLLYHGMSDAASVIKMIEERVSVLGGCNIEGVVVKNYSRGMNYGERAYPIMTAKFVGEKFKEKHGKNSEYVPRSDKWLLFCESLRTDARWVKAVQARRDTGDLLMEPKDIGPMIAYLQGDVVDEHKDEALDLLWSLYGGELKRKVTAGFPEWYKEQLALGTFSDVGDGQHRDTERSEVDPGAGTDRGVKEG